MNQLLLDGANEGQAITAIEVITKDPLLCRIKIGRKTIATLPMYDIKEIGVSAGEILTEKMASKLEQAVIRFQIRKAAMRLINQKAYTRGKLIEKLSATFSDTSQIEIVADDLCKTGAIDDEAYARNMAMSLTQRGPISQSQLKHKLCSRHINSELAQQIAEQTLSENDPIEAAINFARKRMKTMQSKPQIVITRRLWAALSRRGFDSETIRIVMNKVGLDIAQDIDT